MVECGKIQHISRAVVKLTAIFKASSIDLWKDPLVCRLRSHSTPGLVGSACYRLAGTTKVSKTLNKWPNCSLGTAKCEPRKASDMLRNFTCKFRRRITVAFYDLSRGGCVLEVMLICALVF